MIHAGVFSGVNCIQKKEEISYEKLETVTGRSGVIFMLLAFCLPMIFAFGKGENSGSLFWGAIGIAFLVPILIYMF